MSRISHRIPLFPRRWRSSIRLWADSALWSVKDWFADHGDSKPQKRSHQLHLDILERREVPSYGLALYSDAVADPTQGATTTLNDAKISLLDGNVSLNEPITYYESNASAANYDGTVTPAALVYNSNTVNVYPTLEFEVTSGGGDPVPTSVVATLTFDGVTDTAVTFSTSGHSAGDTYLLSLQHGTQITASGYYAWSVSVTLNMSGGPPVVLTDSGNTGLVVNDGSGNKIGAGWSVAGVDSLVIGTSGILYVYGSGGSQYFSGTGPTYTSPANNFGTLVQNGGGGYTYTDPQQNQVNFNSSGQITSRVDPHGLTTTYQYLSGKLSEIVPPDGGGAVFSYNLGGSLNKVTEPGSLAITVTHDASNNITELTNPDGGVRTFTYDADHRVATEAFGSELTTYTLSTGILSSIDWSGATTDISPVLAQGLPQSPIANASAGVAVVTDPLSNSTTYTLDSVGRMTKMVAPNGGTSTWTLNSAGLPTTFTDALGNVTTYTYASGTANVTKIDEPNGGVVTMTYNTTFNKVATYTDELGHKTTYTYDSSTGDLLTVTDALGDVTTYVWGGSGGGAPAAGLLWTETDALGHTTTYAYGSNDHLSTVTDAVSLTTTYTFNTQGWLTGEDVPFTGGAGMGTGNAAITYDAMGRITSIDNGLSNTTTYTYDVLGNLTSETNALGVETTYAYDGRGNLTGETDAVGTAQQRELSWTYNGGNEEVTATDGNSNVTTYGYDAIGWVTTVTDPLGGVATTAFDLNGNVTAQTNLLGKTTTYTYNAMGEQATIEDPLGNVTTTAYDLAGNVRSVTNASGVTTSYGYDALNRQTAEIDNYGGGLQCTITTPYDAVGNVTAVTNALNDTTTYTYDAINRVATMKDALGNVTTYAYLANTNQVAETTNALNNTITSTYDAIGELKTVEQPNGGTTTYVYDAVGNLTQATQPTGATTTYVYDNLNRLVSETAPTGGVTTYAYDANDNQTLVEDPDGNKTTYVYDALNRVSEEEDPTGGNITYAYNAASEVTSETDQLGRRDAFTYDANGNELTVSWYNSSGTLLQTYTYTYDALGNMLTAQAPAGTYTMTYDVLGREATVEEPFGLTLTYSYDAADNQTGVQDNFGGVTTYAYDAVNELTQVQFTGNSATLSYDMTYTAIGQLAGVSRFSDLTGTTLVGTTSYTYDADGNITNIHHKDGSGSNIQNTTYTYDTSDRLTQKQVNGATTTYSYDSSNELTQAGSTTYGYDANGNRTGTGYTTGVDNEITNDGTWTYTYDAAGNLIEKSKGMSAETWTYGYNNANQLVWAKDSATPGGTLLQVVTYVYDALGNQIERDSTGSGTTQTTRFGYDGTSIWADLNSSNALVTRRLYGLGVTPVARISSSGTVAWYLTDYQGSVTVLADGSGTVQDVITYDAYGNTLTQTNANFADRYGYTGGQFDSVTGFYKDGARYYSTTIGKWISQDPLSFAAGDTNLYRYVANGPTDFVDPTGLQQRPPPDRQFPRPDRPPSPGDYIPQPQGGVPEGGAPGNGSNIMGQSGCGGSVYPPPRKRYQPPKGGSGFKPTFTWGGVGATGGPTRIVFPPGMPPPDPPPPIQLIPQGSDEDRLFPKKP